MTFQTLLLAAGPNSDTHQAQSTTSRFRFKLHDGSSLLSFAYQTYASPINTVVALNHDDYQFFETGHEIGNAKLIEINARAQGALATCGLSLDFLQEDLPVLIASGDGIVPKRLREFLDLMADSRADGGAIVFPSQKPNYSYIRSLGKTVIEIAEKQRIGPLATSGVFFFRDKKILSECIRWAILNNIQFEGRYYLAPALNKLIYENQRVVTLKIEESEYFRFATSSEAEATNNRLMGVKS